MSTTDNSNTELSIRTTLKNEMELSADITARLKDAMDKVKTDKEYIPQATTISALAGRVVDVQRVQLDYFNTGIKLMEKSKALQDNEDAADKEEKTKTSKK
jgi:hypothetical protein